ncbi:MAG: PQQ-dependent sugar dehydrogenase [Chloroflexi bacterium]|nr:PQQ-dependent sugar dehydrogenase [Chloroflexota bacterium]
MSSLLTAVFTSAARLLLGLLLAAVAGCALASPDGPPSQTGEMTPSPTVGSATTAPAATARPFRPVVETVASGLEVPWALAFAPDGRLFFTERPGRIRVLVGGQAQGASVATLAVAPVSEAGLMGLALDPAFQRNGHLYVMYTYRDQGRQLRNRVTRLTERSGRAGDERVLLDNLPGANIHDGGRLKFGPDGKLYITMGDAAQPALAQRLDSLAGKVLRLNPDGSIPPDNPYPGSPIYSFGHRNPQGLAWHPTTGTLYSTEHGPVGNDEVNLIQAGANYGWPEAQGLAGDPRFTGALLTFNPAVAPSGAVFYQSDTLWAWRGDFFFATLTGESLRRVSFQGPDFRLVKQQEPLFHQEYGRLRDVVQGPEGALYFATNNRDGRGRPDPQDDRILRIVPGG